jgi:hypothetical protein
MGSIPEGKAIRAWGRPSVEIKTEWSCISTPPICLYGLEKDNITFILFTEFFLKTQKWVLQSGTVACPRTAELFALQRVVPR